MAPINQAISTTAPIGCSNHWTQTANLEYKLGRHLVCSKTWRYLLIENRSGAAAEKAQMTANCQLIGRFTASRITSPRQSTVSTYSNLRNHVVRSLLLPRISCP